MQETIASYQWVESESLLQLLGDESLIELLDGWSLLKLLDDESLLEDDVDDSASTIFPFFIAFTTFTLIVSSVD